MEKFNNTICKEQQVQFTRIVVDSRKNDCIVKLLNKTCRRGIEAQDEDSNGSGCDPTIFQAAVLVATLNNDPETLKAIIDWGQQNLGWGKEMIQAQSLKAGCPTTQYNPILISSLENYTGCLPLLYKAGYRITLPDEDKSRIKEVLNLDYYL